MNKIKAAAVFPSAAFYNTVINAVIDDLCIIYGEKVVHLMENTVICSMFQNEV